MSMMGIIIECSADTSSLAFKHTLELVLLGAFYACQYICIMYLYES